MEVGFCSIVLTLKALRGLGTSFAGMLIFFGYSLDGCVLEETELMYHYKDNAKPSRASLWYNKIRGPTISHCIC
ncbi:unnamed protein product [Eruca vesicaria subsp. sativa]|uniref:Uncharacterized protein n=1 Tax=Eruca vesicaria subsp. sativa TaxID=29727 RepID=A0ABC8K2F5_ERUVS|nr:unnamed protein product [Eruca vesicaria subsp. sativa]